MKTLLLNLSFFTCAMINATPPSIGGYNVYYGHLHNHTNYSDGTGTPYNAYNYAKNTAKLDFFGLSDHDTNIDSLEWVDTKAQANAFNQDGVFSTFYGFEWSYYGTYGHVTVVGTPDYTTVIATNTFENLKTWLSTRAGIAFFNHPGRENANGKEFDHFTGKPSDKFVGIELWNKTEGFSAYYYNDGYTPNDNSKGYYDEALGLGWKIGASGSSDNHLGTWGTSEDSRLAILSNNLTRNDLMQAMQARRFYSTMDKNLALSFKINGQEMGSTLVPGTYAVQVQASDGDGEVFTNVKLYDKAHNVIQEWTPNSPIVNVSTNLTTTNGDYYYVKVTETDGGEAISSPIWIEAADTQAPTAFNATKGIVTSNSVELLLNATDNSGSVTYTISYGTNPTVITTTGVSAIQKSYVFTGLTPSTNYTFTVTAKDAALNSAVNNPIVVSASTSSASTSTFIVTSSPSAIPLPYSLAYLTDGNTATSWKVLSPHASFITFTYANAQIINKSVLTSTTEDASSRDPKNWTIKASNDTLAGWTVLDTRTNQTFATRGLSKTYSFVNNTAYKFYRLHITESNYSTSSTMLGEMAFLGDTIPVTDIQAPTAFTATKGVVTSNSVELLLNATDNSGAINYTISYGTVPTVLTVTGVSATQKSYIITGLTPATPYSFSVTAKDAALNPAANNPIMVSASTSSVVDTIAPTAFTATKGVVTSNSVELLLNATDNSGAINYTISYGTLPAIVTVAGLSATQKSYIVTGLTPATAYSFSVTAKDAALNPAANNPIVVSASTSSVVDTIPPNAFTATKGVVTSNSVELLLNATDNSGSINYTISYGTVPTIVTVTGTSATQKSYIVTGLTPATAYSFSVTAKDAALNPAANNPIVVSANTSSASTSTFIVTSSPSAIPSPYSLAYLTDGNTATSWKVMSPHASFITFMYANAQIVNKSVLTSTTENVPSRDPKNWTIKASNDTLAGWTVLDTRTNQTFATRGLSKTYSFVNNTAYKFYRLHITESNYSTSSTMLGEMAFLGDTIPATDIQAPTAFTATKGVVTSNSVELLLNATDNSGSINYTISYGTVPTIVTVAGLSATQKSYIVTGLTSATPYSFSVTAKDAALNPAANNPIVVSASTSSVVDTIPPNAFTATKGVVTSNSVELLLNSTDNSGSINYTISYGTVPTIVTVTGTSATQKSYIVTGLTPATAYSFSVTAKDAALNPAANNPIVVSVSTSALSVPALIVTSSPSVPAPYSLAYLTDGNTATDWKVMSAHASYITFEYASVKIYNKMILTSTIDDAPSRDPKNWTTKASNDTLVGWTVLDTRTNQTFATRGLSKTYSFVNNTAYKFYRLHITESNYSTSSTMLGEMAFLGDTIAAPAKIKQVSLNDTVGIKIELSPDRTSVANKQLNIYCSNRTLFIQNFSNRNGDLYLYDIYGRFILKQPFGNNGTTYISLSLPAGLYVAIGVSQTERVVKNIILP